MSEAELIPNGWAEKTVGELFILDSGTAPINFRPGDFSGPVLVYGANGPIGSSNTDNYGPGYLVGRVGAAGAVTHVVSRIWASDNTLTATPRSDRCSHDFAKHYLRFLNPARLATTTAQPLITQSNLAKLSALAPVDTIEQSRIAAVLDTVDEAIAKTEAVIAKLKQVRAGMLHDLLTRGLDEHGRLRDPMVHPEQFHDSPLGRIPHDWRCEVLGSLVPPDRPIVYGILMPGRGFHGGVPVIKVKDIKDGQIDTSDLLLTDPRIDEVYRRSRVRTGDLLFTIRGTVGRMAFVPPELDTANITQDTARISLLDTNLLFIACWLEMPIPSRFIDVHTIGVAVKGINIGDVRCIPVVVPPKPEQDQIARLIASHEEMISTESNELVCLLKLKSGLMSDLLTGRVRVPEEIAVAP